MLRLLREHAEGVSMKEFMHSLDVSRRTVYRELSTVEDTIKQKDLRIEKEGKLYRLAGDEADLEELFVHLQEPLDLEWQDVKKRKIAILALIILQTDKGFTSKALAEKFHTSLSTIQQDIIDLNKVLAKYKIEINRTEDQTFFIVGSEVYLRLYLSQVMTNEINEFDFLQVLDENKPALIETESQYLLSLIDVSILQMVYSAIERQNPDLLDKIADDILMNFILLLTITIMRLKHEHAVKTFDSMDHNQLFPYVQQILSIVKVFDVKHKEKLNTAEVSFLAMQLRGMNTQQNHSIFQQSYDMELGFNVKYLTQLVSLDFGFNFNQDDVLYQDLINHIGAALKRLELDLPEIENEVLRKLKKEYPKLYAIVEEKLIEVFSPAIFSEQEIGYVVTHFASSFEKHGYAKDYKVLVVCSSGIGTSKILKTRLERSIPDIEHIDVVRAVDLVNVDIYPYEVIFSTIPLTGFEYPYTLIDPILDEQEIEMIKQRLTQRSRMEKMIRQPDKEAKPLLNTKVSFDEMKQFVKMSSSIIDSFEFVYLNEDYTNLEEYINSEFKSNPQLKEKLNRRLNSSPLAIPNTGLLLLHTTDSSIQQPILKIQALKKPLDAMGMDRKLMFVHRILLMLGPKNMEKMTTDYLGAISSSLIENETYMEIYKTGSAEDLKKLFEHLSVELLTKLLE